MSTKMSPQEEAQFTRHIEGYPKSYWWVPKTADGSIRVGHHRIITGPMEVEFVTITSTGMFVVSDGIDEFVALAGELKRLGDHRAIIVKLRATADTRPAYAAASANRLRAVADLLECHDDTGINICTFGYVENFVNDVLEGQGFQPVVNSGV